MLLLIKKKISPGKILCGFYRREEVSTDARACKTLREEQASLPLKARPTLSERLRRSQDRYYQTPEAARLRHRSHQLQETSRSLISHQVSAF